MNNQCEPSEEEKNDYDSESSCGWSHLNIDGYDRSVEPDPSSFLVIESLDSAPSCGSINIDHTSILSLVDQTERWNESTWEEFCHTQTEAVKRYASASNLAVARNFDSLKALSIKHNSCGEMLFSGIFLALCFFFSAVADIRPPKFFPIIVTLVRASVL